MTDVAERPHLRKARAGQVEIVDVPPLPFLMVDGTGDPNTSAEYREAVEALYTLAYTLRFTLKKQGVDEKVGPLEGLWWADDMRQFSVDRKGDWHWTMMIAQSGAVTPALVEAARQEAARKKTLPALSRVRLDTYHEGPCAQVLHVGPYRAEGATIARLHAFIRERGGTLTGRHHEIYLSDPGRTAPEKLRTILRQPFTGGGTP